MTATALGGPVSTGDCDAVALAPSSPTAYIERPGRIYCPEMAKHLVDIDDEALGAARAELGTDTIKDTVNEALRLVGRGRRKGVSRAIDVLVRAKLEDRDRAWR